MNLVARYATVEVAEVRTPRGGLLRFERAGGGTLRYYATAPSKRWKSKRRGRWVEATAMTTLRDLLDAESACHELSEEHARLIQRQQASGSRQQGETAGNHTTQETATC